MAPDSEHKGESPCRDSAPVQTRRYLVNVDSVSTHQLFTDCVVIGAGIAGLRAAIEAAEHLKVIVACKGSLKDSNTWNAQGGIASVLDAEDSFESHIADTLKAGCGLCEPEVVDLVVRQGPELIVQLLNWGAEFDRKDGRIDITLEGGHSHARIAHAHGDETGRIIAWTLTERARENPNIRILENFYVIDLLTNDDNKCVGIIGCDRKRGPQIIWAANTILATGGTGRLYRETTNPEVATGDGIALAYRAGAVLRDLEFVQFHPTTLYIAGASRALITETLRGEGAILLDNQGRRFMKDYHEAAELAPRDVVSRAILAQMRKTEATHVYLDVRHFDKEFFARRFPGANRLGSNSLLEGLVFGKVAGQAVARAKKAGPAHIKHRVIKYQIPHSDRTLLDTSDVRNSLRALMWRNVGITRIDRSLAEAEEIIRFWQRYVMDKVFDSPQGWECQNMLTVCLLMAQAARMRRESRGTHFRRDFPQTNDDHFKIHIELSRK